MADDAYFWEGITCDIDDVAASEENRFVCGR